MEMKLTQLLPCFMLLSCIFIVQSRVNNGNKRTITVDAVDVSRKNTDIDVRKGTSHDHQKRGLGGFIVAAVFQTINLGTTGVKLWTALSEGCNFEPSICTDREEIKRIEEDIIKLGKQYDDLFYANQWKYLNLKESMINNEYILHYINDTVNAVEDIGDSIDIITTLLEVDLKTMDKMYSSGNDTIETLVGSFEFQFEKIEEMIGDMKTSKIIGLVVQKVAQLIIEKSISYINKVISTSGSYSLIKFDKTDDIVNQLTMPGNNANLIPVEGKKTFWQKTKNLFKTKAKSIYKAFRSIGNDLKDKFGSSLPKNLKKWWKAGKSWKTFKMELKTSFLKDGSTISKIKNFFKHPGSSLKYAIKDFEFKPAQAFLQAVGVIIDGIQMYMDSQNWKKVAEDIAKVKKNHTIYYERVLNSLKEVKSESKKLSGYWDDTISSFQELVTQFENETTSAREKNVFTDVFGLTGIPVDTSDKFFHTDFAVVDEKDLKKKQQVVINFFKSTGEKLSSLRDKFKVQDILYAETKERVSRDKDVNSIFKTIQTIYKNSMSNVIKSYSSQFVEMDVVCAAAFCLPNETVYDYYPLDVFRDTKCLIPDANFTQMKQDAKTKRINKVLDQTVLENIPLKKKPASILDITKAVYASSSLEYMQTYGSNLTEQDVVCNIATIFTDLNSYQFYDLTAFRPDCLQVSDAEFKEIQDNAVKTENARNTINLSMQFCDQFSQCNCPSKLADMLKISVQQINLLIEEYKQENKPTCDYSENNGMCKWQCQVNSRI